MIDPAISQISAVARPVEGKMVRMNSLAVNLDQFMIKKWFCTFIDTLCMNYRYDGDKNH